MEGAGTIDYTDRFSQHQDKNMRKAGRVKSWNAEKGYGFIDVHADLKDIFFHITALQNRSAKPKPGDRVTFELCKGKDGRTQAVNVSIAGAPKHQSEVSVMPVMVAVAALMAMVGAAWIGYLPRYVGAISFLLSLMTFVTYAIDKARANQNTWRIPEANLHLLALCGGWPGALAAQHLLRHKNKKPEFQVTFWGTVALNIGAIVLWKTMIAT